MQQLHCIGSVLDNRPLQQGLRPIGEPLCVIVVSEQDHCPLQQGLKLYRYLWYFISCFLLLIAPNHLESVKSQKY